MDIFSDEYMDKINAIQLPNTKIKILQRLLSQAIDEFKKVNKIMGVEFADRLKKVVDEYNNRRRDEAYANEVLDDVAEQLAQLLSELKTINFVGNVEGRDITAGTVDVVVCDGFVGNIVLKTAEGLAKSLMQLVKETIMQGGVMAKLGGLLIMPAMRKLKKKLDYAEYGGAPLLGVDGGFMICHGSSKALAIESAIRAAKEFSEQRVVEHIRENLIREGLTSDNKEG